MTSAPIVASDADTGWLALTVGGAQVVVPLAQCGEIHATASVQPVPHTKPWLLGVANLKGQVHAVVDLAGYLGLPPAAPPRGDSVRGPLIALPPALGVPAALLASSLRGMRPAAALRAVAAVDRPAWAQGAWPDAQAQTWWAVDVGQLTRQLRFIDVAA